ncbi:MAG: carbohydrate ABC transporter permease [Anaerolineales bacterium]|nr:MAG: carbohydrate ABC transporter permease [Anaerolineales bacterium]
MFDIDLDHHPRLKAVLSTALLAIPFLFVFFPTFWMLSTSLKPNKDAFQMPPHWIPQEWTLENFMDQLEDRTGFVVYVRNGVLVSVATTLLTTAVAVPAGYAFARLRFRAKRTLLLIILASQMFPPVIIVITLYMLYGQLGLLDSYTGMVIAFTSYSLPFSVWMMRGFCETVPEEIEEAAFVDGCDRVAILWRVVVPLIKPGLIAVGLFSFLHAWNNLIFALSLTSSPDRRTIPPGFLLTYVGEFQYRWGEMFAGAVIVTVPTVILFIGLQRFLVRGLTAGAVKG